MPPTGTAQVAVIFEREKGGASTSPFLEKRSVDDADRKVSVREVAIVKKTQR